MAPKPKITKERIVEAAFHIARESGAEQLNARRIAQALHCSTQPVLYHFGTMAELKQAVYNKADRFHTEYLMSGPSSSKDVLRGIGLRYIRFAKEESHLFRFLFQSGFVAEKSFPDMVDSGELAPVLLAMNGAMKTSMAQTKQIFMTISLFAHGYASLLANNELDYDEAQIQSHLERAYRGAMLAAQEEENERIGE